MSCFLNCFTGLISCFASCCHYTSEPCKTSLSYFDWTPIIYGNQTELHLVTAEKTNHFYAICNMYEIPEEELIEELDNMVLWCIYDTDQNPIGAIQIDRFSSLLELKKQVSDTALADHLFSKGKILELSYALDEKNRGRGLGSKVVKAWVDNARQNQWGQHLFAVVNQNNTA